MHVNTVIFMVWMFVPYCSYLQFLIIVFPGALPILQSLFLVPLIISFTLLWTDISC